MFQFEKVVSPFTIYIYWSWVLCQMHQWYQWEFISRMYWPPQLLCVGKVVMSNQHHTSRAISYGITRYLSWGTLKDQPAPFQGHKGEPWCRTWSLALTIFSGWAWLIMLVTLCCDAWISIASNEDVKSFMDSSSNVWAQCLAEYAIIILRLCICVCHPKEDNCLLESSS